MAKSPSSSRASTSTDIGVDFERRIQALYQLLGYQVEHNVHLSSRQCDLICERHNPGGPTIRLLVECKFREGQNVPKEEVTQFVTEYDSLKQEHRLSAMAVVTNTDFTPATRALYAGRTDILLITEASLSDELLNVTATMRRFVYAYRDDPIYRHFVQLRDERKRNLMGWIDSWMLSQQAVCVLLGGFGTGKTTLMQRMKFIMGERYIKGQSPMIPCYFRLRDFARSPDLDAYVRSQLLNEFGASDIAAFQHLLKTGRILLILDGFDEMGKHSNEQARLSFFGALAPLFTGKGKYIITCRPSYFVSSDEMAQVFGQLSKISPRSLTVLSDPISPLAQERRKSFGAFEAAASDWTLEPSQLRALEPNDIGYVQIAPLSTGDIDTYLQLREQDLLLDQNTTWKAMRAKIHDTYDLEDLAKRPILLSLIVETLPKIPEEVEPSPAVIYGHYTAAWLNHEYSKGEVRWLLRKEDKLLFTSHLAFHMYTHDLLRVHYTELPEEIGRHFDVKDALELSYLASDLQASSFLSGDGLGFFEFAHKSFAEFFAAVYLRDRLKEGDYKPISGQPLSQEVLFFLGDLVYVDPELRASLAHLLRKQKFKLKGDRMQLVNLLGVLGYSRSVISQLRGDLYGLPQIKFALCTLDGWDITARIPHVVIDRCSVQQVTLTIPDGRLSVAKSKCVDLYAISRKGSAAVRIEATESSLTECLLDLPLQGARFDQCIIQRSHIQGANPWTVKLVGEDIFVSWSPRWQPVQLIKCSLTDVCFENVALHPSVIDNASGCELVGVLIRDLTDAQYKKAATMGLVFQTAPLREQMEKKALALLGRVLLPPAPRNTRRELAEDAVRGLEKEDRLLLRWILGVTRAHRAQRIEPIETPDAILVVELAKLGSRPQSRTR